MIKQMSTFWFMAWKENIEKAKKDKLCPDAYCRAAIIAQAMSVMYLAIELNKTRGDEMNKELKNLGWVNAEGETLEKITQAVGNCLGFGHKPVTKKEGLSQTVRATSCDECGYVYRMDSGD